MSVHLYFANNSIRNHTRSCDSLGIHYIVSKAGRITSLSRWEGQKNSNAVVGELELPFFRRDRIRVGSNGQWQPLRDYLNKSNIFSISMSFISNNRMKYTWKAHLGHLTMTHPGKKDALIEYHRNIYNSSYLEILDSSTTSALDTILRT